MSEAHTPALAIFARAPIPGYAKKRLGRQIGPAAAARAYEAVLRELLDGLLQALPGWEISLYLSRRRDRDWFVANGYAPRFRLQRGADLGERISAVFEDLFREGHQRAVVVAADTVRLGPELVRVAGEALCQATTVLGPTEDGGYYLLGQRAPGVDLFRGIAWGTNRVYRQTLEAALRAGRTVASLPLRYDLDIVEDWQRYQREQIAAQRASG